MSLPVIFCNAWKLEKLGYISEVAKTEIILIILYLPARTQSRSWMMTMMTCKNLPYLTVLTGGQLQLQLDEVCQRFTVTNHHVKAFPVDDSLPTRPFKYGALLPLYKSYPRFRSFC
ncbi:hypothetical protein QQP08_000592 [Theobroma cacao]|nr:hypothetical protein QQP08_000592 [Theobroma cacao]